MPRLGIHALSALTCGSLVLGGWALTTGPAAINAAAADPTRNNEIKLSLLDRELRAERITGASQQHKYSVLFDTLV
jgi:hypothetical protein